MAETVPPLSLPNCLCDTDTGDGDTTVSVCGQHWESVPSLPYCVEKGGSEEDAREGKEGGTGKCKNLHSYHIHTNMNRTHQT